MTTQAQALAPPIVPYLTRDAEGAPYLQGARCEACGHVFVGERQVCAKCTARGKMTPVHLAETGKLYAFTVVYRSFPGVQTPFIDVIVDLDDGSHIKGVLKGVEPDPASIPFDLPVKVAYAEADPVNAPGKPHLTYHFIPA